MLRKMGKKVSVILFLCLYTTIVLANDSTIAGMGIMHRMMLLALQLGVILFMARLGNIFFEKIKMPGVLGELIAGVLIGPYLLGAVPLPGFPHGLFPLFSLEFPVSPELYGICTIASIVLLFMVGLETDIKLFLRYSIAGSLVGTSGVITSFVLGDIMTMIFSKMLFGVPLGFFAPPCLFLGIISTATSVGISARILSDERMLDSPEGVTILAGAVVDDVLGIILLAIGLGVISASKASGNVNWAHIGIIAVKAVGIWLAAMVIGLIASQKISVLLKWFRDRSSIAIMAFGFALILAGLFEEAGLAMIIGAYVMGLSLSKTDINRVIREKMNPIYALFVPVFFTVMGMLVDIRLLASREVLLFGALYTVVADLAKIVGCGFPALFCNFNMRGASRIGFGMLPRGEVTLIIAGIGLSVGVLNPEMFGVVVLMVLVTALIAPPTLVALIKNPTSGLRKPVVPKKGPVLSFSFPSFQTADLLVTKLLGIFESEGFYVHSLSRSKRIYQLRKDDVVIGFQHRRTDIIFDCSKAEIPFVNTAMYEVLAELEQTVNELKKPVDRAAIGRKLQEYLPETFRGTALAGYLSKNLLEPKLKGKNKYEIIDELLNILDQNGLIKNMDDARNTVLTREESMSTGMQFGIAIPHGRTDAVDQLICAVGIKPESVDFKSIDGKPSKIIILTLSPKKASAPHMQFMSMVSQALNEKGRKALLTCKTPDEMLTVLTGSNAAKSR